MAKYLSREFILAVALIVIGTVALFTVPRVGYTEWAASVGGFITIYTAGKTVQKVKGAE